MSSFAASVGCHSVEGHPDHPIRESLRFQSQDHRCSNALYSTTAELVNSEQLGASNAENDDRETVHMSVRGHVHHGLAIPVDLQRSS